jgi:hypothetical protein
MKHFRDTLRDLSDSTLTVIAGALLLALGLTACEQQVEDQQAEAPATEEKMKGGAPGRVSPPAGKQATAGGAPGAAFQALDTDHDGQISAKEAKLNPKLSSNLKKLDADHDGMLNKTEFSAFRKDAAAESATAGKTGENPNRPTD